MSIDLGNAPVGTPPSPAEKLQILTALGLINTQFVGNANATIPNGTIDIILTSALTAARIYTIPLASSYHAGFRLNFSDGASTITATNTVTLARSGADTINGGVSVVLSTSGSSPTLVSDGISKWTLDIGDLSRGGTGATTVAGARINLGLGTTDSPTFAGLNVSGTSSLGSTTWGNSASYSYGTGSALAHRTALGVGTADSPTFAGLNVNGTTSIGSTTWGNSAAYSYGTGSALAHRIALGLEVGTIIATSNLTATDENQYIIATNPVTISLPKVTSVSRSITISNQSSGEVTVTAFAGDLVDDDSQLIIKNHNSTAQLRSSGFNWYIV